MGSLRLGRILVSILFYIFLSSSLFAADPSEGLRDFFDDLHNQESPGDKDRSKLDLYLGLEYGQIRDTPGIYNGGRLFGVRMDFLKNWWGLGFSYLDWEATRKVYSYVLTHNLKINSLEYNSWFEVHLGHKRQLFLPFLGVGAGFMQTTEQKHNVALAVYNTHYKIITGQIYGGIRWNLADSWQAFGQVRDLHSARFSGRFYEVGIQFRFGSFGNVLDFSRATDDLDF